MASAFEHLNSAAIDQFQLMANPSTVNCSHLGSVLHHPIQV
uniref:Uncharacterized protein n=1 Tax=Arundo donax TaxID=35708 RepID=A0A0A9D0M0_ARUDO